MTECERILKSGLVSPDFLKEETRCGFFVDERRKKLWLVMLDLAVTFDKFCKKHDLKYFLKAGSLLGAVRHKGFIPWDDDFDVCMPRADYEKLLTLTGGGTEFGEPYFLQNIHTEKNFFYSHCRLCNSNTSFIDKPFICQKFNMGIHIDIVPLDNFDEKDGRELYEELNRLHTLNSVAMRISNAHLSERDKERVKNYPGGNPFERYEHIQNLCRKSESKTTAHISALCATCYGYDRNIFPREYCDNVEYLDFENFKFPVPAAYDKILKQKYPPDYMEFPPPEERGKWHGNIFYDADTPYKKYFDFLDFVENIS